MLELQILLETEDGLVNYEFDVSKRKLLEYLKSDFSDYWINYLVLCIDNDNYEKDLNSLLKEFNCNDIFSIYNSNYKSEIYLKLLNILDKNFEDISFMFSESDIDSMEDYFYDDALNEYENERS